MSTVDHPLLLAVHYVENWNPVVSGVVLFCFPCLCQCEVLTMVLSALTNVVLTLSELNLEVGLELPLANASKLCFINSTKIPLFTLFSWPIFGILFSSSGLTLGGSFEIF